MADKRLLELANLIYEKTRTGEITWEKTTFPEGFQTSFPKYSVVIRKPSSSPLPRLFLYNGKGELIEEFSSGVMVQVSGAGGVRLMDELYELARRRAMGVDQALDELLSELQKPREKKSNDG
jgi:hypothetical protein